MFFDQKRKRSDESYKAFPLCATAAGVLLGLAIGAGSANAEPNNHVLRQITNLTTGEIEMNPRLHGTTDRGDLLLWRHDR